MINDDLAYRGAYITGCFHICLNSDFDADLSKISNEDLGTFLHEYIHFLQNISTPYGIFSAIMINNCMCEFVHSMKDKNEIYLPYTFNYSEDLLQRYKWYKCSLGTGHLDGILDISRTTEILFEEINEFPIKFHKVSFKAHICNYNEPIDIIIGSTIIKEGMASMYQSLIDDKVEHNDIPYNVLSFLCKKHFPNIANDTIKIICLCHISLFSLDPGFTLLNLLKTANNNPELTGFQMFDEFLKTSKVMNSNNIVDKFNSLVDTYKESIRKMLSCEINYIEELLEKVKIQNGIVPILNVINTKEFNIESIKALVSYLGIPFIHKRDGTQYYPQKEGEIIKCPDLISIVGNSIMKQYFMKPNTYVCPFMFMCDCTDDECYDSPWLHKNCIFECGLQSISAKGKTIKSHTI